MTSAGASSVRRALLPLVILACALVPYLGALDGGFTWTDHHFVEGNTALGTWETLPRLFVTDAWAVGGEARSIGYYRPTRNLTFLLDTHVFGTSAAGYHFTNVAIHAWCSLLVFGLVRRMFGDDRTAAWAAALFAVHPVHVEAVAWITGRTDSVAALGYLGAVYAWLLAYTEHRVRWGWWAMGCLACAWALLAKESAATLPVVLGVCLWFRNRPGDRTRRTLVLRCAPAALLTVAYLIIRSVVLGAVSNHPLWGGTPWANVLTGASVLGPYARLLVLGGPLVALYEEHVFRTLLAPQVLAGFGVGVLLVAAAIGLRRRYPAGAWGALWLLLTVAPVLQIIPFKVLLAERFLYLPSVGWCVVVGGALAAASRRALAPALVAGCCIVGAYTTLTIRHVPAWADDFTLFEDSLRKAPESTEAVMQLASAHYGAGHTAEARDLYLRATDLTPSYHLGWYNLGLMHQELGDVAAAKAAFRRSGDLQPTHTDSWWAFGHAAFELGAFPEAEAAFQTVLSRRSSRETSMWYGRSLARNGKWKDAAAVLTESALREWGTPLLIAEAANALMEIGNQREALSVFAMARGGDPQLTEHLLAESRNAQARGDEISTLYYARIALQASSDDFSVVSTYARLAEEHDPVAVRNMVAGFITAHPENLHAAAWYVRLLIRQNILHYAEPTADSLVRAHPDSAEIQAVYAEERRVAGKPDAAAQAAARASALAPDNLGYALLAGETALDARDTAGAVAAFERAHELAPGALPVTRGLGRAYWRAGRTADASRVVRAGLAVAPNDPTLLALLDSVERGGG